MRSLLFYNGALMDRAVNDMMAPQLRDISLPPGMRQPLWCCPMANVVRCSAG
jgi:hypothetical protein